MGEKKKTANDIRNETYQLFINSIQGNARLQLEYFHSFLCPVAIAEADVKEYLIEDYDELELLVLRLYEAGFRDIQSLTQLSGMKGSLIERALYNERIVYHHIEPDSGIITDMGYKTLEENITNKLEKHVIYDTKRNLQIEAVTGTVIPSFLEDKTEKMRSVYDESIDTIVPRNMIEYDEELKKEINNRLREYIHLDIINEGDTIESVGGIYSKQIKYRWAFLTLFKGMQYPIIVLRGYKSIDRVNAESKQKGKYGKHVAVPLAVAKTDSIFLSEQGIFFEGSLVREDRMFEYLKEESQTFDFSNDSIEADEVTEEVFEDEKEMEAEEPSDENEK